MRPRHWLYVEIESPSAQHHEVLAEGLIACGASAVEEREDCVTTWLPQAGPGRTDGEVEASVRALRRTLEQATGTVLRLRWERRVDEDWEARWREGLHARRVGRALIVSPSWVEPDAQPGDIVLTIDPEMAFGTGEHASTRGALRLLEAAVRPACRVLDVGTGSGILGIAAARLGAAHVDAVDGDADALLNARDNVDRNGCSGCLTLSQAFVDLDYLFGSAVAAGPYDVVAANVLSSVLIPLLPGFRVAVRAGGVLILAGILETEADAVIEAAAHHAFTLSAEDRDEGWWAGSFHRAAG